MSIASAKYTGDTPGADSNVYTLFSTVTAAPMKGFFQLAGIKKFNLSIDHSHLGTIKLHWSNDRGTTWNQYSSESVATPPSNDTTDRRYFVENYPDWKVEWTNGGTAQSPWVVVMSLSDEVSEA